MRIGCALPQFHRQAYGIERTAEFAREVERAGAASLWVGDRNLVAVYPRVGYGGRMKTVPAELRATADPFVLLAVAASATARVLLGSHVLVAPLYAPVQLARALTSIDRISGGRLLPGFGVGWSPEEYQAAGVDFATRGARMDELLDTLRAIWTSDPAEYQGELLSVPPHHVPLKPVQCPRPPIYLGALSQRALRRVAARAEGWLPACVFPGGLDIDRLLHQRTAIDRLAREAGRDPAEIDTVLRFNLQPGASVGDLAGAIRRVHERTGIDHVMVDTLYVIETVDAAIEYADELIGLVSKG